MGYSFYVISYNLVGTEGIEPSTSFLSGMRSATELRAPHLKKIKKNFLIQLNVR